MSKKMDMTPADVLRAAADELMLNGWTRGSGYGSHDGPKCALGAINTSASNGRWVAIGNGQANEAARALYGFVMDYVPRWNDSPRRTRAQVVNALLSTAADLEARHAE